MNQSMRLALLFFVAVLVVADARSFDLSCAMPCTSAACTSKTEGPRAKEPVAPNPSACERLITLDFQPSSYTYFHLVREREQTPRAHDCKRIIIECRGDFEPDEVRATEDGEYLVCVPRTCAHSTPLRVTEGWSLRSPSGQRQMVIPIDLRSRESYGAWRDILSRSLPYCQDPFEFDSRQSI
jgi:hypothetical protein